MSETRDWRDPLGRIAAQADAPYPERYKSRKDIIAEWQRFYADEARLLKRDDLDNELANLVLDITGCEHAMATHEKTRRALSYDYGLDSWANEQRRIEIAITTKNLESRIVRLTGRCNALQAEQIKRSNNESRLAAIGGETNEEQS